MTEYDAKAQEEDIKYIRGKVLRKFPLLGVTMASLETYPDSKIKTACTDGKNIYYSPKFFAKLSDEEKVFVYAHEVMHVAFNHIMRSKGRHHKLWNIATDSVINQILKEEGLPLVKGGVNIEEALNKSAEEMYEKLLKEREEKRKQKEEEEKNKQKENNSQTPQGSPEQQGDGQEQGENPQNQVNNNQQEENNEQNNQADNEQTENPADEEQRDNGDSEEENSDAENSGEENDDTSDNEEDGDEFDEDIYDDLDDDNEDVGHADHQIWKQAVEEAEKQLAEQSAQQMGNAGSGGNGGSGGGNANGERSDDGDGEFEKGFAAGNKEERAQQIKRARQMLEKSKAEATGGKSFGSVGEISRGEEVVDWKKLLKNSIEKEEMRWSYRRSSAENNYMARVEELESDGQAETEVMLDVSGSVNEKMIKEFLRQLKPILKSSKLKVGCFDDRIYDFAEIKKDKDIDEFKVPGGGGTNLDKAVRAFSKSKKVNKIVFTDGYAWGSDMPQDDLKGTNVIWLVYDNRDFHPCCGKVIYVDKKQFTQGARQSFAQQGKDGYSC